MCFSTVTAALLPVTDVLTADWPVKVGDTGLDFNPSSVMAAPGDTLTFQFVAKNHSVTQSTFTAPCTPMNATSIDSGFMPISDPGQVLNFTVTVNNTNPVWFYCKQVLNGVSHCESGMVFALNPTANKTISTAELGHHC
ncbi:Cupredoxin [Cytidiella melzeri]|nr:Cupredoxin [Cytidiella melzeri]